MASKIIISIILFSSILVLDLVYFFPILFLILILLTSIKNDLFEKRNKHTVR